jgi:hypothetical protein
LVIASLQTIRTKGLTPTTEAVINVAVQALQVPGPAKRDRRQEFARRAFAGLVERGVLLVLDGAVTAACRVRDEEAAAAW